MMSRGQKEEGAVVKYSNKLLHLPWGQALYCLWELKVWGAPLP